MSRPHILISAYALSPSLGSEHGIAWNFISGLSGDFRLTVLYGTSGSRIGVPLSLNAQQLTELSSDTRLIYIKPNKITKILDFMNHKVSSLFFPFAVNQYQKLVLKKATLIIEKDPVVICHQLNPIGYRHPGFLYKLPVSFVWGPIGGMSNLDQSLLENFSGPERRRQVIRNWSNWYFLQHSQAVRDAFLSANQLISATNTDSKKIQIYFGRSSEVIRENAVRITRPARKTGIPVKFIFCGTINQAKALELVLDSLALLPSNLKWELHIVGDGPERSRLFSKADTLKLSAKLTWYGHVCRNKSNQIMNDCDFLLMPSYMDSNPTVLFEAFESGVPALCLNQYGARDILDERYGILLEVEERSVMQKKMAEVLEGLLVNAPESIDTLKENLAECRISLSWQENITKVRNIYLSVINAF